jgi:small subunit ribosomal protein S9
MSAQKKFHLGTGRRKTAVARVRVAEGTGKVVVNDRPLEQFFTEDKDRSAVSGPLSLLDMRNRLDVFINVRGGGITGQAGAASQGVARALKVMFGLTSEPEPAPPGVDGQPAAPAEGGMSKKLRDSGYLTRDSRMKERKKYGRKGARRSFQFSKR